MSSSDPRYLLFVALVSAALPLVPAGRWRLRACVAVSYAFYATLGLPSLLVLWYVSLVSYAAARWLDGSPEGSRGRLLLSTLAILLPLLTAKYWNSAVDTLGAQSWTVANVICGIL